MQILYRCALQLNTKAIILHWSQSFDLTSNNTRFCVDFKLYNTLISSHLTESNVKYTELYIKNQLTVKTQSHCTIKLSCPKQLLSSEEVKAALGETNP